MGTPDGGDALAAIAWCVAIAVLSYAWAIRLYTRRQPT